MKLMVSHATKQLLIPFSDRVKQLWPDAQLLRNNGDLYHVLPHGPQAQIMLRVAGIEAPPPVLSQYDWNGGTPFDTQRNTAALLTSNTRAYVLSDMGTGKTRAALWSWHYLYQQGCAGKLLIVAPLSTLRFTWAREIFLILPQVKVKVLYGTAKDRRELLAQDADIYIINHDGLKVVAKELFDRRDIDTLVLDELAVYRNNSQRSKQMRVFAQRFRWAWGMTGRPMPQAPTDCWAQCMILTPQNVPKYFRHAQTMLMTQVSQYKWVPKNDALDTAYRWMQPSVRYSLDDVVELPESIYRTIDIEMTPEQGQVYRTMANQFAVMVQKQQISAANAGVALGKLLQVGVGCIYSTNPLYATLNSTSRSDMLLELLEAAEHKVIVFVPWRHAINELSALFEKNKIDHAVIHGGTTHREKIFHAFQNTSQYRVLLAHPGCVHHGVTLTAATTVIWYSPAASLEVYEQANARIRRVGQKHKTQFLHLQSSAVERKIYTRLAGRQRLQDEFLEMLQTALE